MVTLFNILFVLNAEIADTTNVGYQIGYKLGQFLPIVIILGLAIYTIRKAYKHD